MTIDFLSNIVDKMEQTKADIASLTSRDDIVEKVIKIDPQQISNWEFRDRQEFELGDIDALGESILLKGQAQPIIVVESNEIFKSANGSPAKYIVIAGYRRWLACDLKNIPVDAIVRKLNFEQAISCVVSENEKEKVSDYSKGMFYYNLLNKERSKKKDLYEKLGIHRSVFDNYLAFSEIPHEVLSAIGNMSNVSARTAATIKLICQKGDRETKAILLIADKISSGIGEKKINGLVNKILSENKNESNDATRVAISKNIFIDVHKDSLTVSAKKINQENLHRLKEELTSILKKYFCEQN